MKNLLAIIPLFFAFQGLAQASAIDEANKLYTQGSYEQAFKAFLPLAEQENAEAQDMVGMMYMLGVGTEKNYALGALWLSLSAQKGVDHARETRDTLIDKWRWDIIDNLKSLETITHHQDSP